MNAPKLVVTGCGRSGTMWIAGVLKAAGIDTAHEQYYGVGHASAKESPQAEVSWLAPCYSAHIDKSGAEVWHIVRDPFSVAASYRNLRFFRTNSRHLGLVTDTIDIDVHSEWVELDFWVAWNRYVVEKMNPTKRVIAGQMSIGDVSDAASICGVSAYSVSAVERAIAKTGVNSVCLRKDYSPIRIAEYPRLDDLLDLAKNFGLACDVQSGNDMMAL